MSANDKTQATFHGMTEREIREARLEEMAAAAEAGMLEEEIAAEGREQVDKVADWRNEPGKLVPLNGDLVTAEGLETLDTGIAGIPDNLMRNAGLEILIQQSGQNSKDHGFHEDWPQEPYPTYTLTGEPVKGTKPDLIEEHNRQIGLALTQKLMLMAEELLESFGEIRDGRSPYQTYFVDKKGLIGPKGMEYGEQAYGVMVNGEVASFTFNGPDGDRTLPLLKPEGFLVEIADLFIRGGDLIFLLKCPEEFIHALNIKHEYNKTRPFKHGREF